jgi:hypothetical protein
MPPDIELHEVRRLEGKMEAMEARILAAIKELRDDTAAAMVRVESKQSARDKMCASAEAANLARDREIKELKDSRKEAAVYDTRLARLEVIVGFLVKFGWVIAAATITMIGNTVWSSITAHMAVKAAGG